MTCSSHEFVIIYYHCKTFRTMLANEWFDDAEGFARPRCSDHPCTPETIRYIRPAFAELALVVVPHGDIHAVLVLYLLFALFKTLVLEIEAVLHQPLLEEFRDIVQRDMYENHSHERGCHVEDDIQRQRIEPRFHRTIEQPDG